MKVKDCMVFYGDDSMVISVKERGQKYHYYLVKNNEKNEVPLDFIHYDNIVHYLGELSESILEAEISVIMPRHEGFIEIIAHKE